METINVINVGGVDKEIEDTVARDSNTTQSSQIQTLTNNLATTNSNLSSEVSARTSADALINTRIDEIVAPTGEAPNPAEIVDARIGADGVIHDALGDAIRTQVSDLYSTLRTNLLNNNSYNVAGEPTSKGRIYNGITWTFLGGNKFHVEGETTGISVFNLFFSTNTLPDWVEKGKTYGIKLVATPNKVWMGVYIYRNGNPNPVTICDSYAGNREFTVPYDAEGFILRLGVSGVGTIVNEDVTFDVFSTETNETLKNRIDNDLVPVFTKNGLSLNEMQKYKKDIRTCGINMAVGDSIYDATKYTGSLTLLTTYRSYIMFERDTLIESEVSNIEFKIHECDSDGKIVRLMPKWRKGFIARANTRYILVMGYTDDAPITCDAFKYISATGLQNDFRILENIAERTDIFKPFLSKFVTAGVMTDPLKSNSLTLNYSVTDRRSCVFTVTKPIIISMRNPTDYVFRFYWYDENDLYHETAWGSLWETPTNVEVWMSITGLDDHTIAYGERPELDLEVWDIEEKPKDYFLAEIEDTISKVNSEYTEAGLCFLLSTDHHTMPLLGTNVKYDNISDMVVNMKAVAKKIKVDGNIILGDIVDDKVGTAEQFANLGVVDLSYSNLDTLFYKWSKDAMEKIMNVHQNLYVTPGNHDDNRYINKDKIKASPSEYDYSPEEMFSYYIGKGSHNVVYNDNNNLDYYVDFDNFKIRAFFLDSMFYNTSTEPGAYAYANAWAYGFSNATYEWFNTQLSLIPADWSVILFSHMSPIKEHNEDNANYLNFVNVKNAIQNFINNGGNYIATLYGHTHGDWSTTSPWLEIAFACQKCENYNVTIENMPGVVFPQRTRGTYTEDAWNVVLILPKSKKIKVIRFGAGSDREFTYG